MARPTITPTGHERTFHEDEIIVSKTDLKGIITYANLVFQRVSGFTEQELLGKPHNIIRHPDMPRCVFKLLWDTIAQGNEIFAYVVNLSKNGDHYWVFAHVTPSFDNQGNITGYHSSRRVPEKAAVDQVVPIYKMLLEKEASYANWRDGMQAATETLLEHLDQATLTREAPAQEAATTAANNRLQQEHEHQQQWLQKAASVCDQAARGNLEVRLLDLDVPADSDLGRILNGINSLLDYTDAFVREAKAVLDYAAQEKFYRRVALRGMTGTFRQAAELINAASEEMQQKSEKIENAQTQRLAMADSFEATVKKVTDSVASTAEQLQQTSTALSETARLTSEQSNAAMDMSAQSVENVRHVAQSTDELQNSVSTIDLRVQESTEIVRRAVSEVDQATEIMAELDKSSTNIDAVVETIAEITKQTQLLSLNAAIEAARAGEAGRGFSIVAAEVRKLAERTREATKQVQNDISLIQSSTANAVSSISQFRNTVGEINGTSDSIAGLVSEQREATANIHANVTEVTLRSESVNDSIQQASTAANETTDATAQLLESSGELSAQAKMLSEGVEEMLQAIRSQE
ncbi:unnamed protein product [Cladocopium goreaui]|uniref:Methyl-accepting chemotaxis protein Amb0994 (Putative torque-sensing protein Amb0994) n=1 Tax=Cladocopium goreaui TaxID=2562237 RepID=A0A9P1BEZ7_9DINO|nr:unnamed protein product [Cladocopium goreaui]